MFDCPARFTTEFRTVLPYCAVYFPVETAERKQTEKQRDCFRRGQLRATADEHGQLRPARARRAFASLS